MGAVRARSAAAKRRALATCVCRRTRQFGFRSARRWRSRVRRLRGSARQTKAESAARKHPLVSGKPTGEPRIPDEDRIESDNKSDCRNGAKRTENFGVGE